MKKNGFLLFIILLIVVSTSGCQKQDKEAKHMKQYQIYYGNSEGTELFGISYEAKRHTVENLIFELLQEMEREPKSLKLKKLKMDDIKVTSINIGENGQITLYYNEKYAMLTGIPEIMYRAATVKTLCQIEGINSVEFYIGDQPLMESIDKAVGFQTSDDFIDNIGGKTKFYQDIKMNLYFADSSGDKLVEVPILVKYDGTESLEKLIMERLIMGPEEISGLKQDVFKRTISKGTKILKTSIREDVCYVYMNESFLEKPNGISNEAAIYSVVNSLCELPEVNKVQFLIDGKTVPIYREKIIFDVLFERNLDLVRTDSN